MPKSITRGPSAASSTFDGFRSRCTRPAAWIADRPSARPTAKPRSAAGASGPPCCTASASDGALIKVVASQGTGPSVSASTTAAVYSPLTSRAAATSRRNRMRNSGSAASSARITLTATSRPPTDRPRYTRPMPPLPRTAPRRYGPIRAGSLVCSSCFTPIPGQRHRPNHRATAGGVRPPRHVMNSAPAVTQVGAAADTRQVTLVSGDVVLPCCYGCSAGQRREGRAQAGEWLGATLVAAFPVAGLFCWLASRRDERGPAQTASA
jgi:hypothetical protein